MEMSKIVQRPPPLTLARFVRTAENRSALAAVLEVAAHVCSRRPDRLPNPLVLHGPSGVGKTHLVSGLVSEVARQAPGLIVSVVGAADFGQFHVENSEWGGVEDASHDLRHGGCGRSKNTDLVIVEDLQHLPIGMSEAFVQTIDDLQARSTPTVLTAVAGPRHLTNLPARLATRLVGGLVVGMEALSAPSRLAVLDDKAQRRQLAVSREILAWLAERLTGGGRQIEGAILQLETLSRLSANPLDVAAVAAHFNEQVEASRPTVERIAQRVSGYFRVEPRQLRSRRRSRQVLLPRQVGMYLARQLTELSLTQIGEYFGGRDHSTVLHACRKVERALPGDAVLSGAVRQLHSDLA
jgi:chromosomal replication initiator protein